MKTKSIIAALLLAASSAFAQVPSYVPTNGLVGWWPFNGNANDESGNGNNGTVNGATLSNDRLGNFNSTYAFTTNSSKITVANNFFNNGWTNYTISIWFNPTNNIVNGCLINSIPHDGFGISYSFYGTTKKIYHYKNSDPSNTNHLWNIFDASAFNYPQFDFNIWNNIIVVKASNNYQYYVNGTLDKSINTTLPPLQFNCGVILGNIDPNFGSEPFNGKLDDIGIWNRALTQQEITALYNAQSCVGNITADGPTTFCAGNFVNLTSDVVGGTYQWRRNGVTIATNSTSRTFKATSTGSYTCVATCNGTALTSNAIQVTSQTNAAVTLSATGATSFCAGDSVTLNATNLGSGYSVQWYRTNISMQGATNYSVVVKQPGTYKTVTRNLANGCSRISSGSIITAVNCRMSNPAIIAVDPVSDEIPATKLGNSTETTMHLFPNPNAGSFTLEYDGIEADFEVQVVNTMGQVIYNDIIPSNDKHLKTTINLGDNMQKGVYVVRIINGENVHESKVMLQ